MKKTKSKTGMDHLFVRSVNEKYYEQQTGKMSAEKKARMEKLQREIERLKREKAQLEEEVKSDREMINGLKETADDIKKLMKKHSKGDNENER